MAGRRDDVGAVRRRTNRTTEPAVGDPGNHTRPEHTAPDSRSLALPEMKSQRGTITNLLVCVLCLFVALQSHLQAQTPKRDPSETLRQLLNLPAPRPPNTDQQSTAKYPPAFFDKNNPP